MYCTSIAEQSVERCRRQMAGASMVELRGDLCRLSHSDLAAVVASHSAVLFTCHLEDVEQVWAEEQYKVAIEAGAKWVDVEISAPTQLQQHIVEAARKSKVEVVISYHNYTLTPPLEELLKVAKRCFELGANTAKVVTTATDAADLITICKLYRSLPESQRCRLVAFAMGSMGEPSRRLSLLEGAPFTFVAPDSGTPTASGQPSRSDFGKLMEQGEKISHLNIPTKATPPASKSFFQRAIVAATMAEGRSTLHYCGELCGDTLSAIRWARTLGAEVEIANSQVTIKGIGIERFKDALPCKIDVGESALLARLTLGLMASVGKGGTIVGQGSLNSRSLTHEIEQLSTLGITIQSNNGHLPLQIEGQIEGNHITIDGSQSSQLASGLLLGATILQRSVRVDVKAPTSTPYLDMTLDVMMLFGIRFEALYDNLLGHGSLHLRVGAGERYTNQSLFIESDWSSAGYLLAAAAIAQSGHAIRPQCFSIGRMNIASHQADTLIMRQLLIGNNNIEFTNPHSVELDFDTHSEQVEQVCDIVVHPSSCLSPIVCCAADAPDAIPTLAVIALFACGESRIGGLSRLTNKESNRRSALVAELLALGGDIDIQGDKLIVRGGKPLRQTAYCPQHTPKIPLCTYGDHRMAMALAVAALFVEAEVSLDNTTCVVKSWPEFWNVMGKTNDK